ncbi:hypothetical protein ACF0H5_008078 [Mactra antiquata]
MADRSPTPKKVHSDSEDLEGLSKAELIARLKEQDQYIKQLESKKMKMDKGDDDETSDRLKQQQKEAARRENTLVHRLTTKEQELQDYMTQVTELKQAQTQGTTQLKSMLLDPAVNIVFQRMAKEMEEAQEKLKQTQNELSAWKFTPDSQTGKRLMARCQMLLQENEELGKTIASGKTAKLEGEIALQKTLVTEMKNNQSELDEFLGDLEEDVEGMQTMIYVQLQQLRESKEQITALEEENARLRAGDMSVCTKTFVKKPDKYEAMENVNQNAYSLKTETDYTPMETRFYQEKTDSDLEAEYSYEGLYENDDKYQEELEQQDEVEQSGEMMGQYKYGENGYKTSYDDYDSHDGRKSKCADDRDEVAMETDDTLQTSSINSNVTTTDNGSSTNHHDLQTTSKDIKPDNSQLSVQSSSTSSSSSSSCISTLPLTTDNTGCSIRDDDVNDTEQQQQQNVTDIQTSRQMTVDGNIVDSTINTETSRKETTKAEFEKTSESSRIPSPKPANKSPGRKSATKSRNSGTEKTLTFVETSNGSPNKDHSPNSNATKQLVVDVHATSDTRHSNSTSPKDKSPGSNGGIKEREPVLQKLMNGVTSTVDDIEDL